MLDKKLGILAPSLNIYFARGFDRVAVGEFVAIGDGAVEVVGPNCIVIGGSFFSPRSRLSA